MSKKPLVRSKKRAVHTNTKDKLSKLIVEVNSIAKELSKVKKGGGDMSKMTGGADIFEKIIKMLEDKKDIITDLKIEFINLLIKGYITKLKDNYVEYHETGNQTIEKVYPFILDIKGIIFDDKNNKRLFDDDNTYVYEFPGGDNPTPDNPIFTNLDSKDKDKIIKLSHILNIFGQLYDEVRIYISNSDGNSKLKPPENCILNYFTKNLNKILLRDNDVVLVSIAREGWDEKGNMIKQGVSTMSKLKNDLIEKIFEYVKKSKSDSDSVVSESIVDFKNLYNSINNKFIYGYDFLKKGDIKDEEITKIIDKLTKIKLTYDILNFIYKKDEIIMDKDKIIYKYKIPQYDDKFSFDKDKEKRILGKENITTITGLREAIKGFATIKDVDKGRTTERSYLEKAISSLYKTTDINTILQDIKEKNESINKLNASKKADLKKADLKKFNKNKFDLNEKISGQINVLNNIKERVIITYYDENDVKGKDEKDRIKKLFNNEFRDKLINICGIEDEDLLKQFVSNDTSVAPDDGADDDDDADDDDGADDFGGDLKTRLNKEAPPEAPQAAPEAGAGGKLVAKYKSTGESVYILYKKKKIKRCVYEKTKGRGKYCKIDGEYKLLSKLKIM